MQSEWPTVKLEKVLSLSRESVEIDPLKTYKQITVRLHHKGVVLRAEKIGQRIKSKQYLAKEGQFIISRIDARNGAMGLVPQELNGAIVTNDFLLYVMDGKNIFPKYFDFLTSTKSFVWQCIKASKGTTNRVRLKPEKFLEIEISLPSLVEQKRIVARIESLMARIEEARMLRAEAVEELEALIKSLKAYIFERDSVIFEKENIGNLIALSSGENLTSGQMNDLMQYPVYGGGGLTGRYSSYMFEESKIVIGRVGARCGCVFVTEPKSWITDNALYLSHISDRLDKKYLVFALDYLDLRQQANQAAQPVISQKKIYPQKIPVPPLPEQRRIASYLDSLQAKVDELKRLQAETEKELEELVPSILDKAFKGEF